MPVSITIHTAERALIAFGEEVATKRQHHKLANFIISKGDVPCILDLLEHRVGNSMTVKIEFTPQQLWKIAKVIGSRDNLGRWMECIAEMPTTPAAKESRMYLLQKIIKKPVELWLIGLTGVWEEKCPEPGRYTYDMFWRATLPMDELDLIVATVLESKNSDCAITLVELSDRHQKGKFLRAQEREKLMELSSAKVVKPAA